MSKQQLTSLPGVRLRPRPDWETGHLGLRCALPLAWTSTGRRGRASLAEAIPWGFWEEAALPMRFEST